MSQHLFLEARWGNGEVDDSHLDESLWGVVWIGHCCSHEEFEVEIVTESLLADGDAVR